MSYLTQSNEQERNKTMQRAERESHAGGEAVGVSDGQVQRHQPYHREVDLKAIYMQGDHSACSKPPVDIDLIVVF